MKALAALLLLTLANPLAAQEFKNLKVFKELPPPQ